ncbi:uncharacterized protein L201_003669 [Kwoniella dendrophila CBS 6074]|uniref:Cryptic loci regulator 2 N-terminal domain-containing protein n=1 Tax=Kwoniella dendrophila CBS 6074 TaxID=1295534 RepID=A0AAX4JTK9_9TREE
MLDEENDLSIHKRTFTFKTPEDEYFGDYPNNRSCTCQECSTGDQDDKERITIFRSKSNYNKGFWNAIPSINKCKEILSSRETDVGSAQAL